MTTMFNALVRCVGGFVCLILGTASIHAAPTTSKILIVCAMVNFVLVGVWLYLNTKE